MKQATISMKVIDYNDCIVEYWYKRSYYFIITFVLQSSVFMLLYFRIASYTGMHRGFVTRATFNKLSKTISCNTNDV